MPTATQSRALQTGHAGLNVSDIGRSGKFYREAFGLEVLAESREEGYEFAFLARDEKLLLTLWQ
jgi:lactoylglutathione lyase